MAMDTNISLEAQIFVLVLAREGSFHRAARQLHITQPALTRKINAIEKQVGTKLFVRAYHRLDLTAAGRLFLPDAQASLRHAERAYELARQQAQIELGPIRLGYAPYVHGDLVPLLERWQLETASPRGMVLETAPTGELIERVIRGRLHAGLGVLPIVDEDSQLWVTPVAREPFCLCLSKNHRLAQKPSIQARELDREIVFWVPRDAHPGFYDRTVEHIQGLGIKPVFHEVASDTQAMDLVSHGFGVALLPKSLSHFSRTGTVFKPMTDLFLKIETALFVRQDQRYCELQDHVQAMLSQIRSLPGNVQ
jgi:LysR family transcriptional regulator, benzoate and cis,cis-muconate-responsive activator of ben and cat genes